MYKVSYSTTGCLRATGRVLLLVWVMGQGSAFGSGKGQGALNQALEAFATRQQMADPLPEMEAGTAVEVQDLLVMNLAPDYGGVAGYLCSAAADQEMVVSALLENMFTSSGATLDTAPGSEQIVQLGWMLRVRPEGIETGDAASPWYEYFSELIPAVIVRDSLLRQEQQGDWSAMTMVNAGVRYLVLGMPWVIAKSEGAAILSAPLEAMLMDNGGKTLAKGSSLSGDREALSVIKELRAKLSARGRSLRASDLVLLGPMGSGVPLGAVGRLTAEFSTPLGDRRIVFAARSPDSG